MAMPVGVLMICRTVVMYFDVRPHRHKIMPVETVNYKAANYKAVRPNALKNSR